MRRRLTIVLVASLAAGLLAGSAGSLSRPAQVRVAFVRQGKIVLVTRPLPPRVAPARFALRQLFRGPTPEERATGLRTALPTGVGINALRFDDGTYVLSFSARLLAPATQRTMATRIAQVVDTLARVRPAKLLVLTINGRLFDSIGLVPQPPTWRPRYVPPTGPVRAGFYPYSLQGVQLRLWNLGYLDAASVTGDDDYLTSQALLAFQGWEGLGRTGTVDEETQLALARSSRPRPGAAGSGRRIEIHRDRSVVLMIEGNEVVRAVHTSTGAYGRTYPGSFRVYSKSRMSWSNLFHVWMPYAAYFDGGRAMHEYPDVPAYPASHGCVRLPAGDAVRVWEFVSVGTPVRVF